MFDYQTYMKENPPESSKIRRGAQARKARLEAARSKLTVRVDNDVFERFRQLDSSAEGREKMINQALRDWLAAQNMKDLVREELKHALRQTQPPTHVPV